MFLFWALKKLSLSYLEQATVVSVYIVSLAATIIDTEGRWLQRVDVWEPLFRGIGEAAT